MKGLLAALVLLSLLSSPAWSGIDDCQPPLDRSDYPVARRVCLALAQTGDTHAQFYLGLMYEHGFGVAVDYGEALKWFRKAAEQGNAWAQRDIGFLYEKGQGVAQDYGEAVKWYRKAAEQGLVSAQYVLGLMYEKGQGVAQDYAQAYMWLNLSTANWPPGTGRDIVVRARDELGLRMTPNQIARAQEMARNFRPKKRGTWKPLL